MGFEGLSNREGPKTPGVSAEFEARKWVVALGSRRLGPGQPTIAPSSCAGPVYQGQAVSPSASTGKGASKGTQRPSKGRGSMPARSSEADTEVLGAQKRSKEGFLKAFRGFKGF